MRQPRRVGLRWKRTARAAQRERAPKAQAASERHEPAGRRSPLDHRQRIAPERPSRRGEAEWRREDAREATSRRRWTRGKADFSKMAGQSFIPGVRSGARTRGNGQQQRELRRVDQQGLDRMLGWRGSQDAQHARLRASLFPSSARQPDTLLALLHEPGYPELIEPLAWTIQTLSRACNQQPTNRVVRAPTNRVFSHIWQTGRVAGIFEKLQQGTTPPPVSLYLVWFRRERFYLVEDGNHRCETAKMRDVATIPARIGEVRRFVPTDWRVTNRGFCHTRTGEFRKAPADYRAAARWLGVPTK
jgi:hypothetical protein